MLLPEEAALQEQFEALEARALRYLEKRIRHICNVYDLNYLYTLGFYRYVPSREEGDQFLSGNWIKWMDEPKEYKRLCKWFDGFRIPRPQLLIEQNKQNKQRKVIIDGST